MYYNMNKFLERVKDKDLHEITQLAQNEVYLTELGTSGVKGAVKKRESGALEYASDLKALIFFLGNGIRPHGINESVFQSFKPLCENLVEKKQFKSSILDIFDSEG